MNNLIPAGMDRAELAALLRDMAARTEIGDSFEGSVQWMMPRDDAPKGWPSADCDFWVSGCYRIGNLEGQGGMRMMGTAHS